ncbi:MAG TPA: glycosyltransferase [Roseiarcus sp.]|nr:glycosyltransferase [Roseiarcus sp.]
MINLALGFASLAVWLYLLAGRGRFWRGEELFETVRPDNERRFDGDWPRVTAIVPARDEADVIGQTVASLARQDYPGPFAVVVVDDQSSDGTASVARRAEVADRPLTVLQGESPPAGWSGKVWAMRQGVVAANAAREPPDYLLFVDADIVLKDGVLRRLVALAQAKRAALTSLMVKLRCESPAERLLVPAFIFFFQMLYPFSWVNDPRRRTAAAAGGCMLVHRQALAEAGGLAGLRGALIDDCALAALMKRRGPIWLSLTQNAFSLRAYPAFVDFGRMVARSAFAELRFSSLRLIVALAAMGLVFLAPPLLVVFSRGAPQALGAAAWAIMGFVFAPTLRLYRRPVLIGLALPAIGAAYILFTIQSALTYWTGRGGLWKGRVQAPLPKAERA